jgi:hypothetical protein
MEMKTFWTAALALLAVAFVALVAAPTVASAAGGMGSASVTCKSGKHVKNTNKCKENGGKN